MDDEIDVPQSRANLVWATLVFQAKLIVDGLRDLVLVTCKNGGGRIW